MSGIDEVQSFMNESASQMKLNQDVMVYFCDVAKSVSSGKMHSGHVIKLIMALVMITF